MVIECNPWEDDHDLSDLLECNANGEAILSLVADVDACDSADDLVDPLWRLLWSLRRVMWREMISDGRVGVRFSHHHDSGVGAGPVTYLGPRGAVRGNPSAWDKDPSLLVFSGSEFADSDSMHMEFGSAPGLFGWPEFSQEYLSYQDRHGSDLYEHSFDAESMLVVDPSLAPGVWSQMEPSDQLRVLTSICRAHEVEFEEFEELWVDGSDVLALIAAHPASSAPALDAGTQSGESGFALGLSQRQVSS